MSPHEIHGLRLEAGTIRLSGRVVPVEWLFVGSVRVGRIHQKEDGEWRWALEWDASGDASTRGVAVWSARRKLVEMFGDGLVPGPPK